MGTPKGLSPLAQRIIDFLEQRDPAGPRRFDAEQVTHFVQLLLLEVVRRHPEVGRHPAVVQFLGHLGQRAGVTRNHSPTEAWQCIQAFVRQHQPGPELTAALNEILRDALLEKEHAPASDLGQVFGEVVAVSRPALDEPPPASGVGLRRRR